MKKKLKKYGEGGKIKDPRQDSYYTPSSSDSKIKDDIKKEQKIKSGNKGTSSNPVNLSEVTVSAKRQLDPSKKSFGTVYPDTTKPSSELASALFATPISEYFHTPSRVLNYGIGAYKNNDLSFNPYQSEISETLNLKTDPTDYSQRLRNFIINNAADFAVPASPKVGQTLNTETGLLKDAYKLNPLAFKPKEGMMYRGLGEEGYKDALESGVFRAKQYELPKVETIKDILNRPKNFNTVYYTNAKNFPVIENYNPAYMAEVPEAAANFGRRYGRKDWSWSTPTQIPINQGNIYKKDWLMGYKPVEYEFGGNITTEKIEEMAKGGKIHIKESKKGTFTKAAKQRGKGVQEFASQVLANKDNYSPAMVKKAVFAKNSSKWKKGENGLIMDEPTFGVGDEGFMQQNLPFNKNLDFQIDIQNPYKFDPALTKSLQTYTGNKPQLTVEEQKQYDLFNTKPQTNINSFKFTPITGNKYLNRGLMYANEAIDHAMNIDKKPSFDDGGQFNLNSLANGIGVFSNSVLSGINFGKGTLDIIGSQLQNKQAQNQESKLYSQSVYSNAMDTRPQDYIFDRNKLAEHGKQIKEIGGKGMPNIEVEGQEHIQLPNGFSQEIQGNSHINGGIPLNLPVGSKVFSEKLKIETPKGKKSYADLAKPFETKKNIDRLESKYADNIQKFTAELMIDKKNQKLDELFANQEMDKITGKHGKQVQKEALKDYMPVMEHGGLHQAGNGKTLRGTGKDVENNFKNLDEVYENYKKHGYTGPKDITKLREWSYSKNPQQVAAYIERSRPTNLHKKIWEEKYSTKEPVDISKMTPEDRFAGYNDHLWDYRAYKFPEGFKSDFEYPSITQPVENQKEKIVFKDNYITKQPNINLEGMNMGVPLPNVYSRTPLNYYKTNPNYVDPRYLNVQNQLNQVTRGQRAVQNNLGSRTTGDISNLLQSQINAYNAQQDIYNTKYNYDRQQDMSSQQYNAQAKTQNDQFNQQTWFQQLEDPIRRRESNIGDQELTDYYRGLERFDRSNSFNTTKDFLDNTYSYYQNTPWQDAWGLPTKKLGGKISIKPKIKKK